MAVQIIFKPASVISLEVDFMIMDENCTFHGGNLNPSSRNY